MISPDPTEARLQRLFDETASTLPPATRTRLAARAIDIPSPTWQHRLRQFFIPALAVATCGLVLGLWHNSSTSQDSRVRESPAAAAVLPGDAELAFNPVDDLAAVDESAAYFDPIADLANLATSEDESWLTDDDFLLDEDG